MKKQAVPDGHGSRRHKCEQCAEVYVCEDCTWAMIESQGTEDLSALYKRPACAAISQGAVAVPGMRKNS